MVVVPIPESVQQAQKRAAHTIDAQTSALTNFVAKQEPDEWTKWLAAAAVVAGGALMVTGNRRAGLAVAAAGTALALIEEKDALAKMWKHLPEYLGQAQELVDKVEHYLEEASTQGHRLQGILRRS